MGTQQDQSADTIAKTALDKWVKEHKVDYFSGYFEHEVATYLDVYKSGLLTVFSDAIVAARDASRDHFAKLADQREQAWRLTAQSDACKLPQPTISPHEMCENIAEQFKGFAQYIREEGKHGTG